MLVQVQKSAPDCITNHRIEPDSAIRDQLGQIQQHPICNIKYNFFLYRVNKTVGILCKIFILMFILLGKYRFTNFKNLNRNVTLFKFIFFIYMPYAKQYRKNFFYLFLTLRKVCTYRQNDLRSWRIWLPLCDYENFQNAKLPELRSPVRLFETYSWARTLRFALSALERFYLKFTNW